MDRTIRFAAALVVALLVSAAPAAAKPATAPPATIGSTGMTFANGGVNCSSALQLTTAPASPSYVVPFDGTITSWTVKGAPQPWPVQLQVYRQVGANAWRLVAETAVRQVPANVVSTFYVRIPVKAGDILGRTGLGCIYTSGVGADAVQTFGYHPAVGSTATPDGPGVNASRLNLSAKVEPDCSKGNRKKPKACTAR